MKTGGQRKEAGVGVSSQRCFLPEEIHIFAFFLTFIPFLLLQIMYNGQPITKMACGAEFSMIMDCKGNLYSFGCPEYGQLGTVTFWGLFLKVRAAVRGGGGGSLPPFSHP